MTENGTPPVVSSTIPPSRYWLRRVIVVGVVVASLTMVVRAYGDPHKVFGFQMFPESSSWQATIYRVTDSGDRVDVRAPWPGGYEWSRLVTIRGLGTPNAEQHATYGIDSTLFYLRRALDYVAEQTPLDNETAYLEAEVTFRRNAGPEEQVVLVSSRRKAAP
jgi:hypothetical protein